MPRSHSRHTRRLYLEALERRELPATYTVVNTNDAGGGSLRQAILDANTNSGLDFVFFSIGSGVQTITPLSPLPTVTDPIHMTGSTQPGYTGTPIIELNGTSAGTGTSGLDITAGSSYVQGLAINRFNEAGIYLRFGDNNQITGNFLGTDVTGTLALGNSYGVWALDNSNNNSIGFPGAGNLISANLHGIALGGFGTSASNGNTIEGNYIGTDASGTTALANGFGVNIDSQATNNKVGGTVFGSGNLISGSASHGVFIAGSLNSVLGNRIGTNAAGTAAIPNVAGVMTWSTASNNTIGGTTAPERNLISGNDYGTYSFGSNDLIQGNYIGTDVTGNFAVPNNDGVLITTISTATIGGTAAGAGNLISGNTIGVRTSGGGTVIRGNRIGTNASGTIAIPNGTGVDVSGNAAVIGGTVGGARNIISGNTTYNLHSQGGAALVQGNYIGTDVNGTVALSSNAEGVRISGGGDTIGGTTAGASNLISGNSVGVHIFGTAGNTVLGNRIGTDAAGTASVPNSVGVWIDAGANNNIGGTTTGAANLISGNSIDGIVIGSSQATNNAVQGNFIGTDVTGTMALGNARDGIFVNAAANNNTVGGQASTGTNVISGNGRAGVHINGSGSSNNSVIHNRIGTDVTGTAKIGNTIGVLIDGAATNNVVGGTSVSDRNIISGNKRNGINIGGNGTNGNRVEGNYIGTDWTGNSPLSNPVGVSIFRLAKNNIIGGTSLSKTNVISGNNSVGVSIRSNGTTGNFVRWNYIGTDPTGNFPVPNGVGVAVIDSASGTLIDGNGIEFNNAEGVIVDNAVNNQIRANVMRGNGSLGIRLINNGNNMQPFPTITSVVNGGGSITINGSLTAAPNTTYALEFFSNPVCDGSGFGEGQTYLGMQSSTTNGGGFAAFSATFAANVPSGYWITSTATSSTGDTSEFSACFLAPVPPPGPDAPRAWSVKNERPVTGSTPYHDQSLRKNQTQPGIVSPLESPTSIGRRHGTPTRIAWNQRTPTDFDVSLAVPLSGLRLDTLRAGHAVSWDTSTAQLHRRRMTLARN